MANYDAKKAKREQMRKKEATSMASWWFLAPLIAILAFIPLITYYYRYDTKLGTFDWFTPGDTAVDFFLHYKMVFVLIACGFMLLMLAYLFVIEQKKPIWIKTFIPLAIYAVIALLSACLSENSYFSFHGIYEQFESVWALLGYCLIAYYSFLILRTEEAIKRTMRWFLVGMILTTLLGLSQAFYHDFFRTDFAKALITPSSLHNSKSLEFKFELGRVYLAVYNPNYVGFYTILTIPILAAIIFAAKKLWQRIACSVLIIGLLIVLFASQSRAGFVALVGAFIIMLICMRKFFFKKWKLAASFVAVACVAFIALNVLNHNFLLDHLKNMFSTTEVNPTLNSIETKDDCVSITYNKNKLLFYVVQDESGNDVFNLVDGNKQEVAYTFDSSASLYTVSDERFPFTFGSVRSDNFNGFLVNIDGKAWYFSNLMKENDTTFYAMSGALKLMKLHKTADPSAFAKKYGHLASGRGYIWDRTLPLLKKYFWLGSGPDTFAIAFPNGDLVSMNNFGYGNQLMTKPHCMYLQIAVQTGVPSLIALLIFWGWYIVSSFRLYWKNSFEGYLSKFGVAILASVIGYLIMGLTNDSSITVTPIFFVLTGMGLGINHVLKSETL